MRPKAAWCSSCRDVRTRARNNRSHQKERVGWSGNAVGTANVTGSRSRRKMGQAMSPKSDRKSTRLNSSHGYISYAVFCLKKKNTKIEPALEETYTDVQDTKNKEHSQPIRHRSGRERAKYVGISVADRQTDRVVTTLLAA